MLLALIKHAIVLGVSSTESTQYFKQAGSSCSRHSRQPHPDHSQALTTRFKVDSLAPVCSLCRAAGLPERYPGPTAGHPSNNLIVGPSMCADSALIVPEACSGRRRQLHTCWRRPASSVLRLECWSGAGWGWATPYLFGALSLATLCSTRWQVI